MAKLNQLKADPSRTGIVRRRFANELTRRFNSVARALKALVVTEDAFGLSSSRVLNTRWKFRTDADKVTEFQKWLKRELGAKVLDANKAQTDAYWFKFIEEGYSKGLARGFDDVNKRGLFNTKERLDFFQGSKQQFIRDNFVQASTLEAVKLLATRTYTDLEGVTQRMAVRMSRILADGFVTGKGTNEIAKQLKDALGIELSSAIKIAHTEMQRAHSEGTIAALEQLGVQEIGVMVEWSARENACRLCQALDGIVLTPREAKGMFPRHPFCYCQPVPVRASKPTKEQLRGSVRIAKAIKRSIAAEIPKRSKRSVETQRRRSYWVGAGKSIGK